MDVVERRRQNAAGAPEHASQRSDRTQEIAVDAVQRRQHQVADRMRDDAAGRHDPLVQDFAERRQIVRERGQAVANVARWQHADRLPELAGLPPSSITVTTAVMDWSAAAPRALSRRPRSTMGRPEPPPIATMRGSRGEALDDGVMGITSPRMARGVPWLDRYFLGLFRTRRDERDLLWRLKFL